MGKYYKGDDEEREVIDAIIWNGDLDQLADELGCYESSVAQSFGSRDLLIEDESGNEICVKPGQLIIMTIHGILSTMDLNEFHETCLEITPNEDRGPN